MDAKPQRIRVRDENAPIGVPDKTLHHRNKSTSALSAMLPNAAKNGPKRAAFGDVSNKANLVHASRDDSSVKNLGKGSEKPAVLVTEKKPAALSQPAQRPASSMATLRSVLNNVPNPKTEVSGKQPGVSQPLANIRKTLAKRDNAVYRDGQQPQVDIKGPSKDPINEVHTRETLASHPSKDYSAPLEDSILRSDEVTAEDKNDTKGHEDDCKVHGEYVTATETQQSHAPNTRGSMPTTRLSYDPIHAQSEPEEYWDEDEYENDEDDGYITARSYRSRGDNTTGATTVLFPKYTNQVKRELAFAKQIVEASRTVEEIEEDYWDTSMVTEYCEEIFDFMRERETKMLPNAHYMDNQAEIQWSMRSVLMDWLLQVHHRFGLLPETLFLSVNYIDRFLSCKIVSLGKLQLVGATALFIAAKYEEINCPSVQEIFYMVDGGYTIDEILKAERFMLTLLQFELGWPGPMSFLRRVSKADEYDHETRNLAKYFLEVTIMDERFVGIPPSFAAAGAHCISRLILNKGNWTPAHVHYSGYTYGQLYPLLSLIFECCENPRKHHSAVFEKYADKRFKGVSFQVECEMRRGFRIPGVFKDIDRSGHVESGHNWKQIST